jgi:hypothetical protein
MFGGEELVEVTLFYNNTRRVSTLRLLTLYGADDLDYL